MRIHIHTHIHICTSMRKAQEDLITKALAEIGCVCVRVLMCVCVCVCMGCSVRADAVLCFWSDTCPNAESLEEERKPRLSHFILHAFGV